MKNEFKSVEKLEKRVSNQFQGGGQLGVSGGPPVWEKRGKNQKIITKKNVRIYRAGKERENFLYIAGRTSFLNWKLHIESGFWIGLN